MQRSRFAVPPIHKPPSIESILSGMAELLRSQAIQIEALTRAVGQDKFDAALAGMAAAPPPETAP